MAVRDVEAVKPDKEDLDFLTFLPLAKQNERGELEGHLARSWEHSPDHREYTYHLRTDVRWDDGVPVTAHDVKFTLDLLSHPDVAEYGGIEATVVDDFTVRIRASRSGYIDDITYFPRHLLEGLEPRRYWQWDFWTHPVGNGPFRFLRYVPQRMMEFEANPDYYRDWLVEQMDIHLNVHAPQLGLHVHGHLLEPESVCYAGGKAERASVLVENSIAIAVSPPRGGEKYPRLSRVAL